MGSPASTLVGTYRNERLASFRFCSSVAVASTRSAVTSEVSGKSIVGNARFFADSEPETSILWAPHNVAAIVAKPPLLP